MKINNRKVTWLLHTCMQTSTDMSMSVCSHTQDPVVLIDVYISMAEHGQYIDPTVTSFSF